MYMNSGLFAKIGADTAENERNFAEFLPKIRDATDRTVLARDGPLKSPCALMVRHESRYESALLLRFFFHELSRNLNFRSRTLAPSWSPRLLLPDGINSINRPSIIFVNTSNFLRLFLLFVEPISMKLKKRISRLFKILFNQVALNVR